MNRAKQRLDSSIPISCLGDLCTDVLDCPHSTPEWLNDGVRIIRNFNIKDGRLDFSKGFFVDETTYNDRIRRSMPEAGDIVISREAPMGVAALIPAGLRCCLGQRLVLLKIDRTQCDPRYLLFVLMSDYAQTQFHRADVTGSTVSNLAIPDLKDIIIPVIENQEAVGDLLWRISTAIELNNQLNDNLLAALQTLYSYWFIQFEFPDAEGKPYKSSGGVMVHNNIMSREIPAGWSVASIVANPLSRVIAPGVNRFETKRYYATADIVGMNIGTGNTVEYETRESRANMQPELYSVWFAKMKNSVKHLFLSSTMQQIVDESILSTGFMGLNCKEEAFEYIAAFIAGPYFEKAKNQYANGATQQAVGNAELEGVKLVIPDEVTLMRFHNATRNLLECIGDNIIENRRLAALRDWLLPMLMNGQATVRQQ